jgi:hypothetical protein
MEEGRYEDEWGTTTSGRGDENGKCQEEWLLRREQNAVVFSGLYQASASVLRCKVFEPRWARRQPNGNGTAPTPFRVNCNHLYMPLSFVHTTPMTTSEWLLMYLVTKCTTTLAPCCAQGGFWKYGLQKVLSTARIAPTRLARAETMRMSIITLQHKKLGNLSAT